MIGTVNNVENNNIEIILQYQVNKFKNLLNSFILIKEDDKQMIAEIFYVDKEKVKAF